MTGISRKLPDTERRRLQDDPQEHRARGRRASSSAPPPRAPAEDELARDVDAAAGAVGGHPGARRSRVGAPGAALRRARPDHPGRPRPVQRGLPQARRAGDEAWETVEPVRRPRRARPGRPGAQRWTGDGGRLRRLPRSTSRSPRRSTARSGCPRAARLVIDRTEAMTVVDVNTGKFTGAGRQPRGDGHPQQPRGGRGDRPPAAAARPRRHHRHRLHRHGAGDQPRPGAAPARSSASAATAPSTRSPRSPRWAGPDDPQAGRPGPARGVQRALRALQRPRRA